MGFWNSSVELHVFSAFYYIKCNKHDTMFNKFTLFNVSEYFNFIDHMGTNHFTLFNFSTDYCNKLAKISFSCQTKKSKIFRRVAIHSLPMVANRHYPKPRAINES